jgi:hypothetical protein
MEGLLQGSTALWVVIMSCDEVPCPGGERSIAKCPELCKSFNLPISKRPVRFKSGLQYTGCEGLIPMRWSHPSLPLCPGIACLPMYSRQLDHLKSPSAQASMVSCWAMASPYFDVQEPLQTCTPCFHTSRTLFPNPEFCYEMSMVLCIDGILLAGELRVWKQ